MVKTKEKITPTILLANELSNVIGTYLKFKHKKKETYKTLFDAFAIIFADFHVCITDFKKEEMEFVLDRFKESVVKNFIYMKDDARRTKDIQRRLLRS